jgi:ferredoxin-NADP reductase
MEAGDVLSLEQPNGLFCPPVSSTRPVVLLAAGIGITPFVSYLRTVAALPAEEQPPQIIFCLSYRSGVYSLFDNEIFELKSRIKHMRVAVFYSRPGASDRHGTDFDFSGRVDLSSLKIGELQQPLIYICGSEEFAGDLSLAAIKLGINKFDIYSEAFSTPKAMPSNLVPRGIVLAGSGEKFEWTPSSGSILDAAQKAKVNLPSGCRAGQCESCRVDVLEGSFAHLVDYQGEGCLTCQAVPLTDLVIRGSV